MGEVVFTRLDDGRLRIDRADPHIHVADEFLFYLHPVMASSAPKVIEAFKLLRGEHEPDTYPHHPQCGDLQLGMICYRGWLLRIEAINQTAVYRIGRYSHKLGAWEAHWAD